MYLNQITWGNPDIQQMKDISAVSFLDSLFAELDSPCPKNDSDAVKSELSSIASKLHDIVDVSNKEVLQRFIAYDNNICQAIFNTLCAKDDSFNNEDTRALISNITNDITPLVTKLKFKFNRPRPNQLASVFKLKLFPYPSKSIKSPAYPSGVSVCSIVILEVIASKNPGHYQFLKDFTNDITKSRLFLGHNYISDIDFSYEVADKILTCRAFTNKYRI